MRLPLHPKLADLLEFGTDKINAFKLELIDLDGYTSMATDSATMDFIHQPQQATKDSWSSSTNHTNQTAPQLDSHSADKGTDDSGGGGCMLRLELSRDGFLSLESGSLGLMSEIVRSLLIDRLHLELSKNASQTNVVVADIAMLYDQLNTINNESKQFEETEQRIQAELYESAEHTDNLMQQFAIAIQLDEL